MNVVDELAVALSTRDALRARLLYAELIQQGPATVEAPTLSGELELAIAAAVVELAALRTNSAVPAWTQHVRPLAEPFCLVTVRLPSKLARLKKESPLPLRRRNLVAPDGFLLSA